MRAASVDSASNWLTSGQTRSRPPQTWRSRPIVVQSRVSTGGSRVFSRWRPSYVVEPGPRPQGGGTGCSFPEFGPSLVYGVAPDSVEGVVTSSTPGATLGQHRRPRLVSQSARRGARVGAGQVCNCLTPGSVRGEGGRACPLVPQSGRSSFSRASRRAPRLGNYRRVIGPPLARPCRRGFCARRQAATLSRRMGASTLGCSRCSVAHLTSVACPRPPAPAARHLHPNLLTNHSPPEWHHDTCCDYA